MHWEKNFAKYIFVKGFVYGIYKNYYILLMKTQITQFLFFFLFTEERNGFIRKGNKATVHFQTWKWAKQETSGSKGSRAQGGKS